MSLNAVKTCKAIVVKATGDGTPDDSQIAAINQFTLREHKPEEVYARTMIISHNGIDRDKEVNDEALLPMLAQTLPGKGFFIKHPMSYDGDSGPGEGRFFHAEVKTVSLDEARTLLKEPNLKFLEGTEQAHLLEASFFTTRTNRERLIADIDAGIAGDVSLGYSYSERVPIRDADEHVVAHRLTAPGAAYEGSLVWLGAQPGARIHKNADRRKNDNEDIAMDKTEELQTKVADLESANKKLSDENAALKTNADKYEAAHKVLGDQLDDLDTLKSNAALGAEYRNTLIDETIKAERLTGDIKDDDEAVEKAKKEYQALDIDRLKLYHRKAAQAAPEGGQMADDEYNINKTGTDGKNVKESKDPLENPFANKAVTG